MVIAETALTNMDSFGNMLAAKVIQSCKESNQFIFFNKPHLLFWQGVSSCAV
jgi:hypothetical protein